MKLCYLQSESTGIIYRVTNPSGWDNHKQLPTKEGERLYRTQVVKRLKTDIKPGDTVYTKLDHVSRSGMSRRISLYIVCRAKKGEPARILNITNQAAIAMDRNVSDKSGIQIGGCGMDMGFALVHDLGYALWPKGTRKPHGSRNGEPDSNGGYALRHEWL